MRLLVVEDDSKIAAFLLKGLRQSAYEVDHADNGEDGLSLALAGNYDAAIVDIMLPRRDGLSLIGEMRARQVATPVIVLSAKSAVDDRVRGLEAGSDDYLVKPFAFSELLARLQALIRRATNTAEPTRLSTGSLTLDLMTREVTCEGKRVDLQPREFDLLLYLMRNAGKVVSKAMIMEHVWNYHFDPQTNVVETRICRLREKVDTASSRLIHTIRGVGYVLREDR